MGSCVPRRSKVFTLNRIFYTSVVPGRAPVGPAVFGSPSKSYTRTDSPLSPTTPRLCRPPHATALLRPVPQPTALPPPMTAKPRGRLSVQRKRKGGVRGAGDAQPNVAGELPDVPNRPRPKWSFCKESGHYAPNCRKAHY